MASGGEGVSADLTSAEAKAECERFIRNVLAALAFLYSDRLPDDLCERLGDADDKLVATIADLVKLR